MRRAAAICAIAALALAGCGGDGGGGRSAVPLTVALDFTPNAVHAPIYAAAREGYDRRHGVRLRIRGPGGSPDSLKLLLAGRADVAVMDIQDLGLAVERGADVVGIAALVKRPLAAIIAGPGIERPRDLEGKRVGVSGLPSDPAVLRPVIQHDGGDFRKLRLLTIGFNAVPNLLQGKVAAVPAFWNVEGVLLRERGLETHEFRLDDYGAPHWPEVVLVTKRSTLGRRRAAITGLVASIADGTRSVLREPQPAVAEIAAAAETDRKLIAAQLTALRPVLNPTLAFDRRQLDAWAAFADRFGILPRRPDVARTFDFRVAHTP